MKKIYLTTAVLSICFTNVFSQLPSKSIESKKKNVSFDHALKPSKISVPKGVVIWSNDFSNGNDWTYDNTSDPYLNWCITNNADTIPVTTLSPAVFTTVNNGFAFIDSDAQGTEGVQNANMTYTGSIDCSAYSNVSIVFEQSYRTYLDTRIIRISNDGGVNWVDFVVTDGTEPTAQNSPNPDVYSINISSVAGGNDSVKVQINYQGNWGWYWAIDDMKIIETDEYDLKLQKTLFGTDGAFGARLQYFQIPSAQVAPINFGGILKNIGVEDITDAGFTAEVTGTYNGVAAPINLIAETTDTVWCSNTFTPNASNATYAVTVAATTSSTEPDVTNNTLPNIDISVNDFIYARDNGQILGGIGNSGDGYEVGHIYDIFETTTLYGIDAFLNANSEPGAEIFVKLYSIDQAGDFQFMDESAAYVITEADLGQKISLPLGSPVELNANEAYLAMVGSYGDGGNSNDLITASSGSTTPQTTFYYDYTDQTWYYTTSNVMVRMNFDPNLVGIEESKDTQVSIYPNPASEVINIHSNKLLNATVSVTDLTGKVVKNSTISGLTASINTSGLNNGIFFVTITDGNSTSTQKVVIRK